MIGNSNTEELEYQLNTNKNFIEQKKKKVIDQKEPDIVSLKEIKNKFMGFFTKLDPRTDKQDIVNKRT